MTNEELILQKLEEMSKDMKEFRKDFDDHKDKVTEHFIDSVRFSTNLEHVGKNLENHTGETKKEIDKIWVVVRTNKKDMYDHLSQIFGPKLLADAQKNAKILGMTAVIVAIAIPVIQFIVKATLKS
jgi:regulator of replication initiation timing